MAKYLSKNLYSLYILAVILNLFSSSLFIKAKNNNTNYCNLLSADLLKEKLNDEELYFIDQNPDILYVYLETEITNVFKNIEYHKHLPEILITLKKHLKKHKIVSYDYILEAIDITLEYYDYLDNPDNLNNIQVLKKLKEELELDKSDILTDPQNLSGINSSCQKIGNVIVRGGLKAACLEVFNTRLDGNLIVENCTTLENSTEATICDLGAPKMTAETSFQLTDAQICPNSTIPIAPAPFNLTANGLDINTTNTNINSLSTNIVPINSSNAVVLQENYTVNGNTTISAQCSSNVCISSPTEYQAIDIGQNFEMAINFSTDIAANNKVAIANNEGIAISSKDIATANEIFSKSDRFAICNSHGAASANDSRTIAICNSFATANVDRVIGSDSPKPFMQNQNMALGQIYFDIEDLIWDKGALGSVIFETNSKMPYTKLINNQNNTALNISFTVLAQDVKFNDSG